MNHSSSTSWLGTTRIAPSSLKKTIQAYKAHSLKLNIKLDQLQKKKRSLEDNAFVILDENSVEMSDVSQHNASYTAEEASGKSTPMPHPHGNPTSYLDLETTVTVKMEEGEYYHNDDASLVSRATDILVESIKVRLSYVEEAIGHLTILFRENQKMKVPPELMVSRYEEWVRTNQRLFELNSQLYDLEKLKFNVRRKELLAHQQEALREDVLSLGERKG